MLFRKTNFLDMLNKPEPNLDQDSRKYSFTGLFLKPTPYSSFEFKIVINTSVCIVPSPCNNFALALESTNSNLTDNYIFKLIRILDCTLNLRNSSKDITTIVAVEFIIWPISLFFYIAYRVVFNSTLQHFSQRSRLELEMRLFNLPLACCTKYPAKPNQGDTYI